MQSGIEKELQKRGLNLTNDGDRGRITNFIEEKDSEKLFKFMTIDKSYRVLFNAIVKSNWLDLNMVTKNFSALSKDANCSIMYVAKCNCGILDAPIITEPITKTFFRKTITCKNCGEIKLDSEKYSPIYDVPDKAFLQVLQIGKRMGFLSDNISAYCLKCQKTNPVSPIEKIACKECGEARQINVGFYPSSKSLQKLVEKQQGYWLEWFIYELLKNDFSTEFGLIYKETGTKTNIDILCLINNELWAIECKDSTNLNDFIKNAPILSKIVDKVCLVSTKAIDNKALKVIATLLGDSKFIYISPKEIEEIAKILKEHNKIKAKVMADITATTFSSTETYTTTSTFQNNLHS